MRHIDVESQSVSRSLSWSLGAFALVAMSVVVASGSESDLSEVRAGASTLLVIAGLWWLWRREQSIEPSPVSEYLAIGYTWALYAAVVFEWETLGDRWVDWLIMIPPVSVLPPVIRAIVRRSSAGSAGRTRVSRLLHRLAAVVFFASTAFLVLTVLAIVVAPIPLIGGAFHVVAGRFYARQQTL